MELGLMKLAKEDNKKTFIGTGIGAGAALGAGGKHLSDVYKHKKVTVPNARKHHLTVGGRGMGSDALRKHTKSFKAPKGPKLSFKGKGKAALIGAGLLGAGTAAYKYFKGRQKTASFCAGFEKISKKKVN